jgi:hypothetical protein
LPRKPTDAAQIKFRIREHLRRKLEADAKRNRRSLSSEVTRRLEASYEATPVAKILQDIDLHITEMETAWARLEATREFLVLADQLTTKIIDHGERDEFGRELVWRARDLRRLRATVDQPLREPGPGVRLQGENLP